MVIVVGNGGIHVAVELGAITMAVGAAVKADVSR